MKPTMFNIFIYVSVIFLIITLYNADYLHTPTVENTGFFVLSIALLFAGFIFNAEPWRRLLQKSDIRISHKNGIISIGLSIFGKYIPGKIWSIVGRPSYIAHTYNYPFKPLATLSLIAQLITLWSGLMIGTIGLFLVDGFEKWGALTIVLWLILTGIIFSNSIHHISEKIYKLIFHKPLGIPAIPIRNILTVVPFFFLQWLTWCAAFYFLTVSLYSHSAIIAVGFGFALAASLGIMSIIAPGGIGVREGVLVGFLALAGYNPQEATTLAIMSRLWFLVGECFIFLLAFLLNRYQSH